MKLRSSAAGETIIEVLIAVAVASFVIGTAYAIANRSLNDSQGNQEHAEALRLAQGQVEAINTAYANSTNATKFANGVTCITSSGTVQSNGSSLTDYSHYNADCIQGSNKAAVPYYVAITYNTMTNVFTVYVHWDALGGGENQVSLSYVGLRS